MKSARLFRILGLVDEDLIEEADTAVWKQRMPRRRYWAAAAACAAVVCIAGGAWLVTGESRAGSSTANTGGSGIAIMRKHKEAAA